MNNNPGLLLVMAQNALYFTSRLALPVPAADSNAMCEDAAPVMRFMPCYSPSVSVSVSVALALSASPSVSLSSSLDTGAATFFLRFGGPPVIPPVFKAFIWPARESVCHS